MMPSVRPFDPRSVPAPSLKASLPEGTPLDVEVGCGVGLHSIRYAKSNPHRYLIAIEHTRARYSKFERRLLNHPDVKNLQPLQANAISFITHYLKPEKVDRYFFLYPNPYPKDSQRNKRWYAMPFMGHCLETLKIGGSLTLATNERYYAAEALDYFRHQWGLELIEEQILDDSSTPRTHFEKKYLASGQPCFNLVFLKKTRTALR